MDSILNLLNGLGDWGYALTFTLGLTFGIIVKINITKSSKVISAKSEHGQAQAAERIENN